MYRQIVLIIITLFFFENLSAQIQFIEHEIDNNTHGMGGIYCCDLDDDGDMDVLAASLEDNQILWFRNDGGAPINWKKIIVGDGVGSAHSVYAADIDGDQDLDIIGAAYIGSPGIAWWRNDGDNTISWKKYTVASSFYNAHEIYCSDVDGDGAVDILGASSDLNTIAWWHNNGGDPITWTQQTLASNVKLAKSVSTGDVDGDGDVDIIGVSIIDNDVICWINEGGSPIQWTKLFVDKNFSGAHRVQAIDMDKDGDIDIVGAGYLGHQIAWWRNDGGNPVTWKCQIIGSGFKNACIAFAVDLDNDNDMDVIGTGQGLNEIAWWRNDGGVPITWKKNIVQLNFRRPWPLYSCDIDGDGDNDIISGSSHNGSSKISWWETSKIVDVEETGTQPVGMELKQNYPNPFNPSTNISYSLNEQAHIKLEIYDVMGKLVSTLIHTSQIAGTHSINWDGRNLDNKEVSSGIYIAKLTNNEYFQQTKMLLLK